MFACGKYTTCLQFSRNDTTHEKAIDIRDLFVCNYVPMPPSFHLCYLGECSTQLRPW